MMKPLVMLAGLGTGQAEDCVPRNSVDMIAEVCRQKGWEPLTSVLPESTDFTKAMQLTFARLLVCDMLIMMPGWKSSKGASLMRMVADTCGIKVMDYWELQEVSGP